MTAPLNVVLVLFNWTTSVLPVDSVPGLDTVLSIASFVVLQVVTQVLLAREGTMNRMWARR